MNPPAGRPFSRGHYKEREACVGRKPANLPSGQLTEELVLLDSGTIQAVPPVAQIPYRWTPYLVSEIDTRGLATHNRRDPRRPLRLPALRRAVRDADYQQGIQHPTSEPLDHLDRNQCCNFLLTLKRFLAGHFHFVARRSLDHLFDSVDVGTGCPGQLV